MQNQNLTPPTEGGPRPDRRKSKVADFRWTKSDSSIFPSYTHLTLPYCVICRQRYHEGVTNQRKQFISEVVTQERLQPKALDGVRLHREFCNAILRRPSTEEKVKNGHIRRIVDDEVKSLVLELSGTNVATTYITAPIKPRASLGIRLPFLVLIVKNMKKYFTFEIQILDDKDMHRRFRVSNFQSTTKVRPFCTTMPIGLSSGWNQIQFNLADFTRRAYGTVYIETMRVQIHANARIRRIYFSDRLYSEEEMPSEYKLFVPVQGVGSTSTGKGSKKPDSGTKLPPEVLDDATAAGVVPAVTSREQAESPGAADVPPLAEDEAQIQQDEEEIPSGAPPTPAEPDSAGGATDEQTDRGEEGPPTEEVPETPITDAGDRDHVESPAAEGDGAVVEEAPPAASPEEGATEGPQPAEDGAQPPPPTAAEAEEPPVEEKAATPEAEPEAPPPE